ncbi:MAG: VWA domain-containing protein [Bacteroidetes bacterium]|nr:VWA domain-containing protein [Bacteroidota bacterium]
METKKRNNIIVTTAFLLLISCIVILAYSNVKSSLKGSSRGNLVGRGIRSEGPLKMRTGLNNRFYYDNKQVYLNVELKADKVEVSKEKTPLNIAIVIDRSGSMDEKNKLTYVKKAVENIIDNLDEGDYVSIVAYNDEVSVLQKTTQVESRYNLKEKVNGLKAAGFTNLSGGMFEGFDQVSKSFKRGYVNRVLLLSDGLANRGITDRFKLADKVRELNRDEGIVISTFGVGNDFNEDLMTDIAEYGKGNYYYIKDAEQIPDIFAHELSGVRTLVAQNTKVIVRYPANYRSLSRTFGYPYEDEKRSS